MFADPTADGLVKSLQPGSPILIGETDSLPDLLYVEAGMKIIGIGEFPGELVGQQAAYGRFARTDDAHHNYYH